MARFSILSARDSIQRRVRNLIFRVDVPQSLKFKRFCFAVIAVLIVTNKPSFRLALENRQQYSCTYCERCSFTFTDGLGTKIDAYMRDYYAIYNFSSVDYVVSRNCLRQCNYQRLKFQLFSTKFPQIRSVAIKIKVQCRNLRSLGFACTSDSM